MTTDDEEIIVYSEEMLVEDEGMIMENEEMNVVDKKQTPYRTGYVGDKGRYINESIRNQ